MALPKPVLESKTNYCEELKCDSIPFYCIKKKEKNNRQVLQKLDKIKL